MNELARYAREYKGTLILLITIAILSGASIIAQAYFIVRIVDQIFLQDAVWNDVLPLFGWLAVALVARAMLTFASGRTGAWMSAKVKQTIREQLLAKYTRNPVQASLQGQSGRKISVMLDAVDEVDSYFSRYIPQVIQTSIVPLMILIAAFTQDLISALILMVTAPFIPLFFVIIGIKTQKKSEEQMGQLSAFSGTFLDTLQGLTTLKLFGQSKKQRDAIEDSSFKFRDATLEVLKVAFISSLMLEYISMLGVGLIALELGLRLVLFESVTFLTAFFLLVLAPEFYVAIRELGSAFHTGRGSIGAAALITSELDQKEDRVQWGERVLSSDQPPEIAFKDVQFKYGEDGFKLGPLNAEISPFEKSALIGKSGSGKTTALHLLSGLMAPSEGTILVDNRPLSEYTEESWFSKLSYISQQPFIFSGTLGENIAIGSTRHATREEIEAAAEKAGLAELISSLEKGLDTPVGEAGRGLSGGEKQRLALARAFLKKPSVILFDEPTTGLDLRTEKILTSSMKELGEHATVITVAHRLYTIRQADQILLLEDGTLSAKGKHDELLKSASYREMVDVQEGGVPQ
ncbi:thiol reductant ABC exporter subunit CydD [Jeotgalibacillus sp. R-1-5s-1]|uniref:thiol reductant ABC exporter subunit CydD n=1 Tax=Jeotgalibacillus sp. R-1-5s-1 TaxID=2555897 RepID=UPI00106CCAE1|nr:thiol reductant ABC exporter subunit CydD [Jeotgalibacillus sp. R-1-5s-1]TFE01810.1 thiol reductant ABC exporter subunit CydD [Jeotgalibacillus sp. R-1-5s-1]